MDAKAPARRLTYIDWARGIAVLLMIEAHTSDAWTRLTPVVRRTIAFRDATVLGGFAAPMFLWLAGLAVVLSATRSAERSGSRRAAAEMICRRGLEIFILAFLFRLQGWIVTPGGHPVTLFRVDILNIMGPAIVGAGLVWGLARTTPARVALYVAVAVAIALAAPIVRALPAVDALPMWVQWHIRPFNEFTTFTLFPWAGFVFAGGAIGSLIAAARDERAERRLHAILFVAGAVLIAIGFYTAARPTIYSGRSSFWTSSPTWFAIRLGILMVALSVIFAAEVAVAALKRRPTSPVPHDFSRVIDPLATLGRNSLFIYWIHVELVYGYASWGWRHRLPLWGTAIGFILFSLLMYRTIGWRDRAVGWWGNRSRRAGAAPQPAVA